MKKLFFLSVPKSGATELNEKEILQIADERVKATGVKEYELLYGEAIHWEDPDIIKRGAVVCVDGAEPAFRLALELKKWLQHGTYSVVLNETSFPNKSFRSCVQDSNVEIGVLAKAWQTSALKVFEDFRIFVSVFIFKDFDGQITVIGNANPDMVLDVLQWEFAAMEIVYQHNMESPFKLYEPEFVMNAAACPFANEQECNRTNFFPDGISPWKLD